MSNWAGRGYVEWIDGDTAYLSVVFSWNIPKARKRAAQFAAKGMRVIAGGPAIALNPLALGDLAEIEKRIRARVFSQSHALFENRRWSGLSSRYDALA